MVEVVIREGRSLEVTPTWSVATVTTVMVFVCLFVERSIYRFGKVSQTDWVLWVDLQCCFCFLLSLIFSWFGCLQWLKKTKRKALSASLEKIKEGKEFFWSHNNVHNFVGLVSCYLFSSFHTPLFSFMDMDWGGVFSFFFFLFYLFLFFEVLKAVTGLRQ